MNHDDRNKDDARLDVDAAADPVIDALIDDVAREMTSAPADAGLARRVSARIDAERETRTWPRAWLLAPAAAAGVLALAVFVAREHPEPAPVQTVQANREAVREGAAGPQTLAAPAVTAVTSLKGAAPGTASRTAPAAVGTRPAAARPVRTPGARPASPDLGPLAPIVLEPVNVSPLVVVMPIEISTIAIDRIEIPAMP